LNNVTGVLFYVNRKFLQAVEGREEDLRRLMANIEKDPRHKNVQYLIDTPVMERGFKRWDMDAFYLGRNQPFDAETLRALTESFRHILLPRSDVLVRYYKMLLKKKAA
jgi:hypothetical protein